MVLPQAAMLALAAAAKIGSEYYASQKAKKQSERRAKETKRETFADVLNNALQRKAELEANRLSNRKKMGARRTSALQDTGDIVRGALSI